MLFEPPAREPGDIFCPRCGARNKASYRFCTNCAADLAAITGLPAGAVPGSYPVRLDVAYPEKLSRMSTFFRLFLAIPQLLIIYALGAVVAVITFIVWFAILFSGRYPKGLFDVVVGLNRWGANVYAYVALFRDEYPPFSTDPARYPVLYDVDYPEHLSRWLIFVKWLLGLGHQFVLSLLGVVAGLFYVLSWFAILIAGKYPKPFFSFNVGLMRWSLRVQAYTSLLRDEFPPFSKRANARPGSGRAVAAAAVLGLVMTGLNVSLFVFSFAFNFVETQTVDVSYAGLQAAQPAPALDVGGTRVSLARIDDPYTREVAEDASSVARPTKMASRFVAFDMTIVNVDATFTLISRRGLRLKDSFGDEHEPMGSVPPIFFDKQVRKGQTARLLVVFEIDALARPVSLTYSPGFAAFAPFGHRVRYVFH